MAGYNPARPLSDYPSEIPVETRIDELEQKVEIMGRIFEQIAKFFGYKFKS